MSLSVVNEGSSGPSRTQRFTSRAGKALTAGPTIHSPPSLTPPPFPQATEKHLERETRREKHEGSHGSGGQPEPRASRGQNGPAWLPRERHVLATEPQGQVEKQDRSVGLRSFVWKKP